MRAIRHAVVALGNELTVQILPSASVETSPVVVSQSTPGRDGILIPVGSQEEWRPVVGFEADYEVSSFGRVRRSLSSRPRFLTPPGFLLKHTFYKGGYRRVSFFVDGKQRTIPVHRLVAKSFLTGYAPHRQVNHKNGIKGDNRVENLEWVTAQENVLHSWRMGLSTARRGEASGTSILSEREAKACLVLVANGVKSSLVASAFGVSAITISHLKNGHRWQHLRNT